MSLDESYPGIQPTTPRKAGDLLTVTAIPLLLAIVPEELRESIQKKLEDITLVKNKGHLDTGMLGT